ncbi:MFS transporter [Calidifontibacter sp. DB0510]|uniref:MFS transporter n=1 Tax=Metallococcus carri TaxID=1656884 RepID=A0A967E9V4_9MICO|nr:MFS transporter [Metallococcus carri]NHN55605.1 MFS transporter [Metallococcus carri]NOP38211.1 MFS transporter [Calidifontibacter sp. DB2511S]
MSPTFASLSIYNYRVYAAGAIVSNVGTWMGRVAQDWLVLTELTSHDSTALGIVTGLQFAPVVLLAPYAGSLTDRLPKRRLLYLTQSALALTSAILALLVLTHTAQLWHVYALALAQGVATALDNPTRQAFVSEMVPQDKLTNAVGLNSASFNAGRLIGPAVAGLLIAAIGTGWTLVANTISFVGVLVALKMMRGNELRPAPRATGRGGVRAGLAYVRGRPDIMLLMAIVFMLGTFGMNFQITIALMSTAVFHEGAEAYGLLGSVMAIGSLSAALMTARRPRPRLRILLTALVGFTIASAAAALAPAYWLFGLLLIPTGLAAMTVMTTANSSVQLSVDPVMRGRVMALYMAIFMGGTPLGAPLIGWIGSAWGPRWTILVGSIATGLTAIAAILYLMRSKDLAVRLERHPWHLQVLPRREAADAITPERVA